MSCSNSRIGNVILKAPYLKQLYHSLLQVSSHAFSYGDEYMATVDVSDICFNGQRDVADISALSDVLFSELDKQFTRIMLERTSEACTSSVASNTDQTYLILEELVLLFQCCLIIMHTLEFNLTHVMGKSKVLLRIFRQVLYLEVKQESFFSDVGVENDEGTSGSRLGNPVKLGDDDFCNHIHFKCLFLEAIAEGILLHRHMVKHLRIVDLISEEPEKVFVSHSPDGFVLELFCSHLILSSGGRMGFTKLYNSLFWPQQSNSCNHFVSLTTMLLLLENRIHFSLPSILQTHILLLTSACVGIFSPSAYQYPNVSSLNYYLTTFERSVYMYKWTLHRFGWDKILLNIEIPSDCGFALSFESIVRPTICSRIEYHSHKLEEWYHDYSDSMISAINTDKEISVMAYVKENQHIIEESFTEETFLFLKYITSVSNLRVVSNDAFDTVMGNNWQAIFHLAAVLKLASSSLLHIIWSFKQTGSSDSKNWKDGASSRAYDCMLETIFSVTCMINSVVNVPDFLNKPCSADYKGREIKSMLTHFIDLFSYSLNREIVCLWKGSIFMIMVLLNLLIFDQGNVEALKLFKFVEKVSASAVPFSETSNVRPLHQSTQGHRKSSIAIAFKLQQIHSLHLKEENPRLTYKTNCIENEAYLNPQDETDISEKPLCILPPVEANAEECGMMEYDGCKELYLHCIGCKNEDVDELADFIDYTPGKNYIDWMKNKIKFRKWKANKSSVARHRRRMKELDILRKSIRKRKHAHSD